MLAGGTVVARDVAQTERASAAEAVERAQALDLAQQARNTPTTMRALELARAAVELHSTTSTRSALAEIEGEAAYRHRITIPGSVYTSAAVSDNGQLVLAGQRDGVMIGDMGSGTSWMLPAPEPLGLPLALTPDGRTAYAVSARGHLFCLDLAARQVTVAGPKVVGGLAVADVVAIDVASDGSVWWMTTQGVLRTSFGCAEGEITEVFRVPHSVTAFDVLDDQRRLVVVTADNTVVTYGWDAGDGQTAVQLAAVALADLPDDEYPTQAVGPPDVARSVVIHCGPTVHVTADIVRGGLPSGTHAAFDLDGRPLTGRTTNLSMWGLGCGPDGDAWAVPLLTPRPAPLPATALYPVGIADARDAGTRTLVAESPGQKYAAVVHLDGRVDVLDAARAPWGRQAGATVVAVPLRGGTVLVSADGTLTWQGTDGIVPLGRVEGEPSLEAVGTEDRAYLPVGAQVVEVRSSGITRVLDAPGPVVSVTLSAAGDEVLAQGDGWWLAFPIDGDGEPREVRAPELPHGEVLHSLQVDGDRTLATTQYGRLLLADRQGEVTASVDVGVAGVLVATFGADHGIVAIGQDGVMRSYTPELKPKRSTLFGAGGIYLRRSADGGTLLVSLTDYSVWAVDAETLEVVRRIGSRSPDVRLVLPSPDGAFVVRVLPADAENETPAGLERISLGG